MKRFYNYFLSLFLLTLAGITSAVAQDYKVSDPVSDPTTIVGKDIVLKALGSHNGGGGFLCGSGFSTSITADVFYVLEAAGTDANGNPIYTLKQKSTGLYFKDHELKPAFDGSGEGEDTSDGSFDGKMFPTTTNVAEAMKVTCKQFQTGDASSAIDYATSANDFSSQAGFVLARANTLFTKDGSEEVHAQFIGHYSGSVFYSIYNDTNVWEFRTVSTLAGKEKFDAYYDFYFSQGQPTDRFTTGTTAGTYPAGLVKTAQDVYTKATAAIDQSLSDEAYEALCVEMKSAMEAVENGMNPLTDGLYLIHDSRDTNLYLYGETASNVNRTSCKALANYDGTFTKELVPYVWRVSHVTNADGKEVLTFYNENLQGYMQKTNKDNHYLLGNAAANFVALHDGEVSKAAFRFQPEGTQEIVCTNPQGWVLSWTDKNDAGNHFVFVSVNEDEFKNTLAKARQEELNANLQKVFSTAFTAYNKGIVYNSSSAAGTDADFTHDGYLVDPGADENNTNWWCNAKEESEGKYMALNDANLNTYFHTSWSAGTFTPTFTKNHYLVATLNEAVTGALEVKLAKRHTGNDYPTMLEIYGTNEFDGSSEESANAAQWTDLGTATINWAYPVTYPAWTADDAVAAGYNKNQAHDEKTIEDGIGTAYVKFDGSYKYIKLAAVGTIFNKTNAQTDRGYFCLAQANIWKASTDAVATETPEMAAVPEAIKTTLSELLNAAKTKLATGGDATQEEVTALKTAYDNFISNYPDVNNVTKALTTAKKFLKDAQDGGLIGTELGLYDENEATALETALNNFNDFSSTDVNEIKEAVKTINDALAKFKASIILPVAGKVYMLHSASTKVGSAGEGFTGTLYNSIVYSPNTDASTSVNNGSQQGTVKFFRADGSADITEAKTPEEYESVLTDTIDVQSDLRTAWYAEKSKGGKIVLRNVATGMYIAPSNGQVLQSTTPVEIPVEGVGAKTFRLLAGVSHDGSANDGNQTYLNTNGSTSTVVAWKDASDVSSYWKLDEVTDFNTNQDFYVDNKVSTGEGENYYIATMPVAIDPQGGDLNGQAYSIVGVSSDNANLVLAKIENTIPAGTPFIYSPFSVQHGNKVAMTIADASGLEEDKPTMPAYSFEVKNGNGLIGSMTHTLGGSENFAFFNAQGKLAQANTSTTIPVNSGLLDGTCSATTETGDATIALGSVNVTGINTAKAVVLPAIVNVYSIDGTLIRKNVKSVNATNNLPAGIYVVGGQKVLVK